jgi:hypothetical protein
LSEQDAEGYGGGEERGGNGFLGERKRIENAELRSSDVKLSAYAPVRNGYTDEK